MLGFILAILLTFSSALPQESKSISIFNVVKFPNDVCDGSGARNGTCYTAEECSNIGGTHAGSCAEGYGVCCVVSLSCGGSTAQNCTYLTLTSTTSPTNRVCKYNLCPANTNICRIRLDFTTFTIAGPFAGNVGANTVKDDGAVGQCRTDTFSATGTQGGSPVICGVNTGQHMYVDTDGTKCAHASFVFASTSSITRAYDIKVLQFDCTDADNGGPVGCLQYHNSGNGAGLIASFNYPIGAAAVAKGTDGTAMTHLANQRYSICFRRNANMCALCFRTNIATAGSGTQSFGLSVSNPAQKSEVDATCTSDYLEIPQAVATEVLARARASLGHQKICGSQFIAAADSAGATTTTVCTGSVPFRIGVVTDATEAWVTGGAATTNDDTNHGIIGFALNYWQTACV